MYLVWLNPASTRAEVAEAVLGPMAGGLLSLDPLRLSIDVWDPDSDIPAPAPTPEGETPLHALVSLWIDAVDYREPFEELLAASAERLAGYEVVESLYRDYGGNQWSAPRSWPDGRAVAGCAHGRPPAAAPGADLRRLDDEMAHPDLAHHRGDPAPLPLRPQRRLPGAHRRGPTDTGHRGGGVALPGARDGSPCCSTAPTATPSA